MKSEIHDFKYFGSPICKTCHCLRERIYRLDDPDKVWLRESRRRGKYLTYYAARRARDKGLPFDLDKHIEDINDRVLKGECELTGIHFDLKRNGEKWRSPSIDRVEPDLGYVYSNIRIILWGLNSALGTWGEDVFSFIAESYLKRK